MKKIVGISFGVLGLIFIVGLLGQWGTGTSNLVNMGEFSWPGLATSILSDVSDGLSNLAAMMS